MKPVALLLALLSLASCAGCAGQAASPAPVVLDSPTKEATEAVAMPTSSPLPQDTDAYSNQDQPVQDLLRQDPDALFFNPPEGALAQPRIVVHKAIRRLEFYDGETLIGRFHIALGNEPEGDKERQGDGRTPVGDYYVCMRNEASKYHLSLGVSYPSAKDAQRGLSAGLIDDATFAAIQTAIENKKQPPWNTALGGEICIHGGGTAKDWTAGCIALSNDDIEALFALCPLGTPISILE